MPLVVSANHCVNRAKSDEKKRLRYSPRSIEALDDIQHYISKDNPSAAWVVASFIRQSIGVLILTVMHTAQKRER